MPQDRESGAAGNAFGHDTAPKIAAALGATMIGNASNEATYQGQHVVIKCAGKNTTSVGVTYTMLDSLDLILAAFQHKDGSFDVYSLGSDAYRQHMRDSRSRGADGTVGLVTKKVFEQHGKRIKIVRHV
jgi:hypothetical protein